MSHIYALYDPDPSKAGCKRISLDKAKELNSQNFGIFHTVNDFNGDRKKENLIKINAWAIDIDEGEKEDQYKTIQKGLPPSLIVETKKGYHVYFKAEDANPENYTDIIENYLVPFYNADPRAKDVCRILRTPGFFHCKDPNNKFLVKETFKTKTKYSERYIKKFYAEKKIDKKRKYEEYNLQGEVKVERDKAHTGRLWDTIYNMDCEDALRRLSGSEYVHNETYSFRRNTSGTKNIYVNGKSTSSWIDKNGRIGSVCGGGPHIVNWLKYFKVSTQRAIEIVKLELIKE